jgi:hypothetical protein
VANHAVKILHQNIAFYGSRASCALVFLLAVAGMVRAQGVVEDNLAPPPLRVMSSDEKTRLTAEGEVKRRTKLALELMDLRLKQAEKFDTAEDYDPMYVELGAFHGIMDNMLEFLNKEIRKAERF